MEGYTAGETASTTWAWKKVKIKSATRQGTALRSNSTPSAPAQRRLNRAHSFSLVVQYRGGPESSWLVRWGDRCWRVPGWMAFEDVVSRLEQTEGKTRSEGR